MDKERIIFIDDEDVWRDSLSTSLREAFPQLDLFAFANATDAREYLETQQPHQIAMIIADAILGPLDRGAELLRFCRTRVPHAKRVLISNKATRDDLEYAINESSLDGYIEKREELTDENVKLLRRLLQTGRVGQPVNESELAKILAQLQHIHTGTKAHANLFKNSIKDLIAYAFYPWFTNPRTEVQILDGTKAIDILFCNASDGGFFADIKARYGSMTIPIETKNTRDITSRDFDQLARYMTKAVGRCGILCFRGKIETRHRKQAKALQRDEKLVLLFQDLEIARLCELRSSGARPPDYTREVEDILREKQVDTF
jgi:DNA-binding NarL/FixJ family response regulator